MDHELSHFSPAKELKRSGSEAASWDPDIESSGSEPFQPSIDTDQDSPHHFRGSSFGEDLENPYVSKPEKGKERTGGRELPWQEKYKTAGFELERASQRNQELIELLSAKEAEVARLREDLEALRLEVQDSMQAETSTRELIKKLETELVRGTQRPIRTKGECWKGPKVRTLAKKRAKFQMDPRAIAKESKSYCCHF